MKLQKPNTWSFLDFMSDHHLSPLITLMSRPGLKWRRTNGEYQNPCCGPGIETSPYKIKPYFGKLWEKNWSLQNQGSWRPFWEGSGPFTKSRPSIFWVFHLSSMMKFPLHPWGSGYDSVRNSPYKIKGKKACFWGTTPWFCKGNCQGYVKTIWKNCPLVGEPSIQCFRLLSSACAGSFRAKSGSTSATTLHLALALATMFISVCGSGVQTALLLDPVLMCPALKHRGSAAQHDQCVGLRGSAAQREIWPWSPG